MAVGTHLRTLVLALVCAVSATRVWAQPLPPCDALAKHLERRAADLPAGELIRQWENRASSWFRPLEKLDENGKSILFDAMAAAGTPEDIRDHLFDGLRSPSFYRFDGPDGALVATTVAGTLYCENLTIVENPLSPKASLREVEGGCWSSHTVPAMVSGQASLIKQSGEPGDYAFQVTPIGATAPACGLSMAFDVEMRVEERQCAGPVCDRLAADAPALARDYLNMPGPRPVIHFDPWDSIPEEMRGAGTADRHLPMLRTSYNELAAANVLPWTVAGTKYLVVVGAARFAWRNLGDVNIALLRPTADGMQVVGAFHIVRRDAGSPTITPR